MPATKNTNKVKIFTCLLILATLLSCSSGKSKKAKAQATDTIAIDGGKAILFGKDSTLVLLKERTYVIYSQVEENQLRYRIYNQADSLIGLAYKSNRLAFDSTYYSDTNVLSSDSLVLFHSNGKVAQTGYVEYYDDEDYMYANAVWQEYWEYDEHGNLAYHIVPTVWGGWHHIGESYHPNGQLKHRWEQGEAYASGTLMNKTAWNDSGHKIWEDTYEHFMPEGGSSYNDRFSVITRTEYYPNGKVKHTGRMKTFVESECYPCGKWIRYDSLGRTISVRSYPPCNNFKLEQVPYIDGDNSNFEYTVQQVTVAFCLRSNYMINELVSDKTGLYVLFRRGVYDTYDKVTKFDFEIPVPEYWSYPEYSYRYREVWYESLPIFSCNTEEWSKTGLYCDTLKVDNLLSRTAENLVKYEGDVTNIAPEDIRAYKQLEMKSRRVVLVTEEDSLIFYLTLIDGKWYITILDRVTEDCSA